MSRFSVGYHDTTMYTEPEPIRLEHVDAHDSLKEDYFRVKFGEDLTIFTSAARLEELAKRINEMLHPVDPRDEEEEVFDALVAVAPKPYGEVA